jgi:hypothetical protein
VKKLYVREALGEETPVPGEKEAAEAEASSQAVKAQADPSASP